MPATQPGPPPAPTVCRHRADDGLVAQAPQRVGPCQRHRYGARQRAQQSGAGPELSDAALADRNTEIELGHERDRLSGLGVERTKEVIQAEIDALDPVADADRIALLEREKAAARTDAEVGSEINSVLAEIEALESMQIGQKIASSEAYDDITGKRGLTEGAVMVLRSAFGLE